MEPLGNSSPTPNQRPPLLYAHTKHPHIQSAGSKSVLLRPSKHLCLTGGKHAPTVHTKTSPLWHQQQPVLYETWLCLNSQSPPPPPSINIWALTNGSGWPLQLQHLSSLVRMENEQAPLCPTTDYILKYMMKHGIRFAGIRFQILCTNQCFQNTESLCFVH